MCIAEDTTDLPAPIIACRSHEEFTKSCNKEKVPYVSHEKCKCTNMQLLLDAAFSRGLVTSRDLEVQMRKIVCSETSIECMLNRDCAECQNRIAHDPARLTPATVVFFCWEKVKRETFSTTECSQVTFYYYKGKQIFNLPLYVSFRKSLIQLNLWPGWRVHWYHLQLTTIAIGNSIGQFVIPRIAWKMKKFCSRRTIGQ